MTAVVGTGDGLGDRPVYRPRGHHAQAAAETITTGMAKTKANSTVLILARTVDHAPRQPRDRGAAQTVTDESGDDTEDDGR